MRRELAREDPGVQVGTILAEPAEGSGGGVAGRGQLNIALDVMRYIYFVACLNFLYIVQEVKEV
jgi:hypothetical protein